MSTSVQPDTLHGMHIGRDIQEYVGDTLHYPAQIGMICMSPAQNHIACVEDATTLQPCHSRAPMLDDA